MNITRRRGDTKAVRRVVRTGAGNVQPIAGWSFVLTVNELSAPPDTSTEIGSVAGTIIDADAGRIAFYLTAELTATVGTFYFDIQATDDQDERETLEDDEFVVLQDKTKHDEAFVWTPPTSPADGASASVDGSEHWAIYDTIAADNTYQTREGRRVIRDDPSIGWGWRGWLPYGPEFPRQTFPFGAGRGWEWKTTFYTVEGWINLSTQDTQNWTIFTVSMDARSGATVDLSNTGGYLWENNVNVAAVLTLPSTVGWPTTGWFVLGLRINPDRTVEFEIRPEATAPDWRPVTGGIWHPYMDHVVAAHPAFNSGPIYELWKHQWRRLQ